MPKPSDTKSPAFLHTARAFYADAFEPRRPADLAHAMAEFGELDDAEQRFAIAHLVYLNLQGQAELLRVLADVRDAAEDMADRIEEVLEDDDDPEEADDAEEVDEPPNEDLTSDEVVDREPDGVSVPSPPADTDPAVLDDDQELQDERGAA